MTHLRDERSGWAGGRILVVFDGSSRSRGEVRRAVDLAVAGKARIDLIAIPLHPVWELFVGVAAVMTLPLHPVGAIESELVELTKEIPLDVEVRTCLLPTTARNSVFDHFDRGDYDIVLNGYASLWARLVRRLRPGASGWPIGA